MFSSQFNLLFIYINPYFYNMIICSTADAAKQTSLWQMRKLSMLYPFLEFKKPFIHYIIDNNSYYFFIKFHLLTTLLTCTEKHYISKPIFNKYLINTRHAHRVFIIMLNSKIHNNSVALLNLSLY